MSVVPPLVVVLKRSQYSARNMKISIFKKIRHMNDQCEKWLVTKDRECIPQMDVAKKKQ